MDDFLEIPSTGVRIEQPNANQEIGLFYRILLFLAFVFILATHFILILEGTGRSLPAFLRFPVA